MTWTTPSNLPFAFLLVAIACEPAAAPTAAPPPASPASTSAAPVAETPPAHPTPREALVALSKRGHTLAVVDPATLTVIAKMPVGEDPHEVAVTADGRFAYVSNYGGGAYNTLAVVDLEAQASRPSIDLGALRGPHGLVVKGGKVWFTAEGAKVVGAFNPATHAVDWVIGTGQDRTHMVFVFDDMKRVLTTNVSSATLSILDKREHDDHGPPGPPPGAQSGSPPPPPPPGGPQGPRDNRPHGPPGGDWQQTLVPVGRGSEGFDVSPDGREAWVANAQDGTISIVDLTTKTVSQTLNADVPGANRLKFTLDGKRALVSSLRNGDVSVFDVASRQLVKRVPLGHGTSGILMQPSGTRAYVACPPDNAIAVVDLQTLAVVGHVDVGQEPDGMAWAVRP